MPRTKASVPTEAELHDLTVAIEQLAEEVHVLRQALDEFRQDFAWMLNNPEEFRCQRERPAMHITSMPKDPCAPDFGERVNNYSAKDLPGRNDEQSAGTDVPEQGTLW